MMVNLLTIHCLTDTSSVNRNTACGCAQKASSLVQQSLLNREQTAEAFQRYCHL
jgi:hypothetical protein